VTALAIKYIGLDLINENPNNPRRTFVDIDELAADMKVRGVLQPVMVRPSGKTFELIFGARRYRAAKLAGLEAIPAMVRELTDVEALEIMVVENAKRADVHPLEEAHAFHELQTKHKHDVAKIAAKVGRSVNYVYDRLKLLNLTKEAQKLFLDNRFTAGHAVILARLEPKVQDILTSTTGPEGLGFNRDSMFEEERTLFDMRKEDSDGEPTYKVKSVKELQAWVDRNVLFDAGADTTPMLFPETFAAVENATKAAEKIVHITQEHHVNPLSESGGGQRIYGPRSWKDASKEPCDHAVTGVIVIGAGRGEAFKVCIDKKKCGTHWRDEIRAAKQFEKKQGTASATNGEDRYAAQQKSWEEQRAKEEAERQRVIKARKQITDAIVERMEKLTVKADGPLVELIESLLAVYGKKMPAVPAKATPEAIVRNLANQALLNRFNDEWTFARNYKDVAKLFGVDAKKIIDEVSPKEKAAKADAGDAKAKGKSKAKSAKASA
jgi:ParB/RepB/Spo0J family partition protein